MCENGGHCRTAPQIKYTIIPTKITINPHDKTDLLKHHRIAIHHWEVIYSVEHHVQVGDYSGVRESGPRKRDEDGDDDGDVDEDDH